MFKNFKKHIFQILDSNHEAPIIHSSKRHLGIILTLLGYILYAFYTIFFQIGAFRGKVVSSAYSSFFELTVLHLVMLATFLVFCLSKGISYFKCQKPGLVIFRAVIAIALLVAYSYSRVWTDDVDNSMLYSTDALWLVIILALFGIRIPVWMWIGVIIGTGGIFFVYSFDVTPKDFVGGIWGLLSGILLSVVVFITRFMVRRDPPLRIGFYNALIGSITFIILTIIYGIKDNWSWPNPSSTSVMLVSGFIWALALFCFLEAFYFTESHVIGAIALFLPVFTETFNWAINEAPLKWTTAVGSLIMGIGGLIVIVTSYHHDLKNHKNGKKHKQFVMPETISDE